MSKQNKLTLTVTLTQTTVLQLANTKWQYTPAAYHKNLTNSGANKYINIESPNHLIPQVTLIQVAQKFANQPPAKSIKKLQGTDI